MKAVFFDANGILYYRVDKHGPMRRFLQRHHMPVPVAKMVHQATAAARQRAVVGAISKAAYYDAVLAAWGVADPQLRTEGHRVQDTAQNAIILHAGVSDTLRALKARSFKLGIVTNSVASTADKLRWFREHGLTVAWDAIANSMEVGVGKPDPRLYLAALEQSGVAPAEALFVGHKQAEYAIAHFADLLDLPVLQSAT
jgi:FMN phosphatase YigB (HAD superfamily)